MVLRCASESGKVSHLCAVVAIVVSRHARILRGASIVVRRRVLRAIGSSRAILDVALNMGDRSFRKQQRYDLISHDPLVHTTHYYYTQDLPAMGQSRSYTNTFSSVQSGGLLRLMPHV